MNRNVISTPDNEAPLLAVADLVHRYRPGDPPALVLPELTLGRAGQLAVMGASGSGKSTLLHLLAGVLTPSQGSIRIAGRSLAGLGEAERDRFRGRHIGLVYQKLHLIHALSAAQNLALARYLAGLTPDAAGVAAALAAVGLAGYERALPARLSQGQRQRVALARALVTDPLLILADEPTASLDDRNAERVASLLTERAAAARAALVVTTHDRRLAAVFEQRLWLDERDRAA